MITALECTLEIQTALKKFGEYSYLDKGPDEVMDMTAIEVRLSDMPAKQIADVLFEVRIKDRQFGEHFVSSVLGILQNREDLGALYDDARINDLY